MSIELWLLCIFGALLELDTAYAFQLTFSRGIIAGPLLALLTGDFATGIQAGVFAELLFSDVNPLGAILPPSATICCAITVALHALGIELCYAFIAAVLGSLLFIRVEHYIRKQRVKFLPVWEDKIMKRPKAVTRILFDELLRCFLINFVFLALFIGSIGGFLSWLQPHINPRAFFACQFAFMAVPWIGLASLIPEFRLKKR